MPPRRPTPPDREIFPPELRGLWWSIVVSVAALVLVVLLFGCAKRYPDPPVIKSPTLLQATLEAEAHVKERPGLKIWQTTGTPSMEPLIRGVVLLVAEDAAFGELREGDIAVYQPAWHPDGPVVHRLVLRDSYGWIASGDNNPRSESWERVTTSNYLGRVVAIYTWEALR